MGSLNLAIIVFVIGAALAFVIYFFIKRYETYKSGEVDVMSSKSIQDIGVVRNIQVSVWVAIKVGFGFTLGVFIATSVIYVTFISLLGLTLNELLSYK